MISNLKRSLLFISILGIISCSGGSNLDKIQGAKIGEVNGKPVYFGEVWNEYQKSNSAIQDSVNLTNFTDFAHLYLDFKTKLAASADAGYFNDETIKQELKNYEEQYALPFWLEKEIEQQLLDEYTERANFEMEVSHILISIQPNEPPEDTLKAYNKLMDARKKALSGANFDSLSNVVSSLRDGRSMGGPLGWMSVGWAVKPFEDVAYSTAVGSISMPFMTQFGMHILLVKQKRARSWDRKASHVYWRSGGDKVKQDSIIAVANQLRADILSGKTSWDSVVIKYTDDGLSKNAQGNIGWVSLGRYYPAFNDTLFNLKKEGDISMGFYSGYGVHLLRYDSLKTFSSPEAKRAQFLTALKNLPRYKNNKEATNERLRAIAKAKKNTENAEKFRKFIRADSIDAQKLTEVILPSSIAKMELFNMRGKSFTADDFLIWLKGKYQKQVASDYIFYWFDDYVNVCTESFLVDMTKERFADYKRTTEEYQNGLVVFKITEDSVWNYVKTDTTNLVNLYNKQAESYRFEKRYNFWRISSSKDSLINVVKQELANGMLIDSIKTKHKGVFFVEDMISDISDDPFYRLGKIQAGETTEVFEFKKRQTILFLKEVLEPRTMTFDEAFFRVVADYQPEREKTWISNLRTRYKSTLYTEVLERSFNEKKPKS